MKFIYLVVSGSWWQLSQQIAHTQQETADDAKADRRVKRTQVPLVDSLKKGLWALVDKDKYPLLYVI